MLCFYFKWTYSLCQYELFKIIAWRTRVCQALALFPQVIELISLAVTSNQTYTTAKKKSHLPKWVRCEQQCSQHKAEFLAHLPKALLIGGQWWEITKSKGKRAESKGSSTLPAREVPPHMDSIPINANVNSNSSENITPVCLISDSKEAELRDLSSKIPTLGLGKNLDIFTQLTVICLGCNKDLWSRRSKYKS